MIIMRLLLVISLLIIGRKTSLEVRLSVSLSVLISLPISALVLLHLSTEYNRIKQGVQKNFTRTAKLTLICRQSNMDIWDRQNILNPEFFIYYKRGGFLRNKELTF